MTVSFRQTCHAVMASDDIRVESSSGGAFTILARNILARGGAVCGVAFDENFRCHNEIVRDETSLARLRGSKYVKVPIASDFLAELHATLESGVPVLFTGTPCQVAAVRRKFTGFAEELVTVDLICAGCPDQKLFDRYLDDNWGRDNVAKIEFRSKARGWRHHHYLLHVVLKDGREVWREKEEDEYMTAMSSGLGLQDGCLNCPVCSMERPGDLTIGDFWQVPAEMDDAKGTSVILVNTEKGRRLFESVRPAFAKISEYPPASIAERQIRLRTPPSPAPGRELFRVCIASGMSVKDAVAKALSEIDRNVAVLNFHWETVNFGAVLTAYALNKGLRGMGFDVRNIDFRTDLPRVLAKPPNAKFDEFRRRHIPSTQRVGSAKALKNLNARYASFVVGSDQVWNPSIVGWYKEAYFLLFANPDKRIVSAAASFGVDPVAMYERGLLKRLMGACDAVGVREASAGEIISALGVPVKVVADPVFLLRREEWLSLSMTAKRPCGPDVVVWYAVNPYGKRGLDEYFRAHKGELEGRLCRLDAALGIEEWLASVSQAPLVLTDSFHGVCFAVIFNRPFAVLVSRGPKSGRMRELLEQLGLEERMFDDPAKMPSVAELGRPLDDDAIQKRLDAMRNGLAQFLKEALSAPVPSGPARAVSRLEAVRALRRFETNALFRVWLRTGLGFAKMAAKFALARDVTKNLERFRKRCVEIEGLKAERRRLLEIEARLKKWKP